MIKKFLTFALLAIVATSAYLYWSFKDSRVVITPYPYGFDKSYEENFKKESEDAITKAQNAKILILGDRMGKSLDPYLPSIKERFKQYLQEDDSIFNWSEENEGLFRTIHKLKLLNHLPPIILYFGASSELFEKRFSTNQKEEIDHNFEVYDDENLISLIITFPVLSKIFYHNVRYFNLKEFTQYKNILSSQQKLEEKELAYKLFNYEFRDMITYIQNKKSHLILITTPINLEVEPQEVCAHSTNEDIIALQQEIESELKEGQYKLSFQKIDELSQVTFANARSFYLLGTASLRSGDIKKARDSFHKAAIFDCGNWRGNAVYNAIMSAEASSRQQTVIDFDQLINSRLSDEGLFFDDILPQNSFYLNMVEELNLSIKSILDV